MAKYLAKNGAKQKQTLIPRVRDSLEKLPDIKGKLRQLKKKIKM